MTQEEWREHRQKMQSLTPEERQSYSEEIHQKIVQRARERGISLPETPGPWRPALNRLRREAQYEATALRESSSHRAVVFLQEKCGQFFARLPITTGFLRRIDKLCARDQPITG